MTSQHTQHGMPQKTSLAKKSWLTETTVFGLTKNDLILWAIGIIIIMIFTRLNWDRIVTFW